MEKGRGRIELILGPMFSGKTSQLITRLRKFQFGKNKKSTIILKWDKDFRMSEWEQSLKTHDGREMECKRIENILTIDGKIQPDLLKIIKEYDVIGIDEGHFFSEKDDLVTFCELSCDEHNKIVIITSLDGNYRKEGYTEVLKLIPKCDSVTKLYAVCSICSSMEASFSHKKVDNGKIVDVGSDEKYMSLCRQCYRKSNMLSKIENRKYLKD